MGLADIARLSSVGLSARPSPGAAPQPGSQIAAAAPPIDEGHARALREAIVASEAKKKATAASAGLRAAIQRQIASARPGYTAPGSDATLAAELVTAETDRPVLGLAKAVARLCVNQAGAVNAAPAIERVRALAAGIDPSSARGAPGRTPTTARVLGAVRP